MDTTGFSRKQIANRLFLLRGEHGLSLDDVAKKSGISRATLSRIENADVSPTADTLSALCATFDIPLSRLIAETEDSFSALIPFEDQRELTDAKTGFTGRAVSPKSPDLLASVEEGHLPPDKQFRAEDDDLKPSEEIHLIVLDGALNVRLGKDDHDLTAGDCLRYKAYQTAVIQTPPSRGARFLKIRV